MKVVSYISQLLWILPVALYLLRQRHLESPYFKMLFLYALVNLIAEGIARACAMNNIHNAIVYNILDVVSIAVYFWGVRQNSRLSFVHRLLFWVVLILSILSVYLSHSFINAYSNILIYGFIGFTSLIMLFKLTSMEEVAPMELGVFWLFCGFIIYSFSELSLYFLLKYIMLGTDWGIVYFRIYNLIILLITAGMFSKALLWKNKN